jgi:hypothetical protein
MRLGADLMRLLFVPITVFDDGIGNCYGHGRWCLLKFCLALATKSEFGRTASGDATLIFVGRGLYLESIILYVNINFIFYYLIATR